MIYLRVFELEGVVVISLSGNLDIETSGKFKDLSSKWCEKSQRGIVIDLREVDYVDSIGLGSIISVFNRCVSSRKKTAIVAEEGEVMRSIRMAKLDKLLDLYESISSALESFN